MKDYRDILKYNLDSLRKSYEWLQASHSKCLKIDISNELTVDEMDAFEALSSRFARIVDILLKKVFRSIEEIELTTGGTLLDVVHRFQKRGLKVEDNEIRYMREIRNLIFHEYIEESLNELFVELIRYTSVLMNVVEWTFSYAEKLIS